MAGLTLVTKAHSCTAPHFPARILVTWWVPWVTKPWVTSCQTLPHEVILKILRYAQRSAGTRSLAIATRQHRPLALEDTYSQEGSHPQQHCCNYLKAAEPILRDEQCHDHHHRKQRDTKHHTVPHSVQAVRRRSPRRARLLRICSLQGGHEIECNVVAHAQARCRSPRGATFCSRRIRTVDPQNPGVLLWQQCELVAGARDGARGMVVGPCPCGSRAAVHATFR